MSNTFEHMGMADAAETPPMRGAYARQRARQRWMVVTSIAALVNTAAWLALMVAGLVSAEENSLAENIQAIALLLGATAFALAALQHWCRTNPYRVGDVLLYAAMALLCLTGALREVPVEKIAALEPIHEIAAGGGRNVLLAVLWGILGIAALLNIRLLLSKRMMARSRLWLRTPAGFLSALAIVLLVLAQLLDINFDLLKHPRKLLEEAIEVTATLLLAGAALWAIRSGFERGIGVSRPS